MKKKRLVINLTSNITSFIISLIVSFFLTPFLIKKIGKEAYSFFPMANNFVSYISIITLTLNSMASRYISIEFYSGNIFKAKKYYSSVFISNIIITIFLIVPLSFLIFFLEKILNVPLELISSVKILFLLIFISMFINLIASIFGISFFLADRLDIKAESNIFKGILKVTLFFLFFKIYKPNIIFIGICYLMLSIYEFGIQYFFMCKYFCKFKISFKLFDTKLVKELIKSGIWNSLNSLGSSILLGMSLVLTNYFIGAEAGGDYSIALVFPGVISGIICVIVSVFQPRLTKIYAKNNKEEFSKEIYLSQKILGLITTVPICLLIIYSSDFFRLWVPMENIETISKLSIILLLPLIIHGNMWNIYSIGVIINKVKIPAILIVLLSLVNLVLIKLCFIFVDKNIFIIPCITGILSFFYYLFFIPTYMCKESKISLKKIYIHFFKNFIFIIFFLMIMNFIKNIMIIENWKMLFIYSGITGLIGFIVNLFFVIDKTQLILLLNILKKYLKGIKLK